MNANENSFAARDLCAAREFTRHLTELLRKEQGAMVNFLLALAECDGRRLWADLGYASLFEYLHRELNLSRSAAYYRAAAAGLVQRYPEIADALADGRLCLTSLAEIGKVITAENAPEILPRFFHRSSREAKEIVAEIAPHPAPPKREVVTIVRTTGGTLAAHANLELHERIGGTQEVVQALGRIDPSHPKLPVSAAPQSSFVRNESAREIHGAEVEQVQPLTATLRRIHFTVTKGWMEKLDAAKCALSHSIPSGSAEEVIEAAFDALLEREAKRKAMVKNPRAPKQAAVSSASPTIGRTPIPAYVRREVTIRDEGRCQAKLHDGTICGSKVRLQLDHAVPAALGGPPTVENIQLRCERHNQLAARKVFGDSVVDLFTAHARTRRSG